MALEGGGGPLALIGSRAMTSASLAGDSSDVGEHVGLGGSLMAVACGCLPAWALLFRDGVTMCHI